ncbi:3-methyl-2-oxobutanoate hydroxymethyltransferase [Candidatus Woesearchaeota archaeon]|nr:3-methyl-2-oxobutanoate hydroxymethyltransferase [Candidatus Woesearchaeota archaeon]
MKTIEQIKSMKNKEKIAVLTCYDYFTAKILDSVGIDIILVGDSLANVVLGYETTRDVTMNEMKIFTEAVARGAKNSFIVGDMPYLSDRNKEEAVKNAKIFVQSGANAVKIEGNKEEIIKAIIKEGIPVMGHLGLLPQTAKKFEMQGKDKEAADKLVKDAKALESYGCFCIVLECVVPELAEKITQNVNIPTIGIGSGKDCDGQVLVINDILGLCDKSPSFAKKYTDLGKEIRKAVENYINDVKK